MYFRGDGENQNKNDGTRGNRWRHLGKEASAVTNEARQVRFQLMCQGDQTPRRVETYTCPVTTPGGANDSKHMLVHPSSRWTIVASGLGGKVMSLFGQNQSSLLRNLAADRPPGLGPVMSSSLAGSLSLGALGAACEVLGAGTSLAAAEDKDARGGQAGSRGEGLVALGRGLSTPRQTL